MLKRRIVLVSVSHKKLFYFGVTKYIKHQNPFMCETEWIFKKIFYQFHTWRNFVETFVETGEKIFLKFCFVSGSFHCFTHEKRKNSLKINFFSLFHRLTQIKINIYSPVNKYFNLVLHRKNLINLQDSFFTCFHRCLNKSRIRIRIKCVKLVKNEGILLFSVWKQVEKNSVNVFTLKLRYFVWNSLKN